MPLTYLLSQAWHWIADTGINLAILLCIALLVPRAGRLAERLIEYDLKRKHKDEEHDTKNTLALAGVAIYILQLVAYFILLVLFLQQLGFSLAGATIPATIASAAIGFGAQQIIADFMAGFFILTEKQYGVGDWVRFVGNGVEVEGEVIQLTMRATQIRTLKQETVVISNSTARVSINASNYWSRAVVVISVPLQGSDSPQEAASRAESAVLRALSDASLAESLQGDLLSQPAVGINPPATVGMPWTIDMRFMIQVAAGEQWAVERAIRMAILEEFWEEYGSATTISGELRTTPLSASTKTRARAVSSSASTAQSAGAAGATEAANKDDRAYHDDGAPTQNFSAQDAPETAEIQAASPGLVRAEEDMLESVAEDPAAIEAEEKEDKKAEEEHPHSTWRKVLTAGYRIRLSSMILLLMLALLLVLKLLMSSGETYDGERVAGPLAPPPASTTSTEASTSTTENTPAAPPQPTTTTAEPRERTTEVVPTPKPSEPQAPTYVGPTGTATPASTPAITSTRAPATPTTAEPTQPAPTTAPLTN